MSSSVVTIDEVRGFWANDSLLEAVAGLCVAKVNASLQEWQRLEALMGEWDAHRRGHPMGAFDFGLKRARVMACDVELCRLLESLAADLGRIQTISVAELERVAGDPRSLWGRPLDSSRVTEIVLGVRAVLVGDWDADIAEAIRLGSSD